MTAKTELPVPSGEAEEAKMVEGWELPSLVEVCQLNPTKPPADFLAADAKVSFVPMPAVDAELGSITAAQDRPFGEVRNGHPSFREGDVIMAKITPCMENGKAAVARALTNGVGFGSTEFHVLRPTAAILAEYVYHFIRRESFREAAANEMTGSVGQKRVPPDFLKQVSIPLPPLDEQYRIIDKVGASLRSIDAARQRLAKVPVILRRFRQSVLAAACSGRLTADWREGNGDFTSASTLIDRIKTEKQRLSNGKKLAVPEPPNPDFEAEFPETWALTSMDDLTCLITSGSRDWKQYYIESGSGTFIMAQNVRPLCFDRTYRLAVNPPTADRDRVRSQVRKGDVLVTIVGANTGDVCRIPEQVDEHYVCQSVALMRPVLPEMSAYLELYLNSPEHGKGQFSRWIYGEGRPHLGFDHLRAAAIGVPPLAEQYQIVRRVEALFRLADTIEKRVAAATARAEKLTQAILAKAFRGELVPTEAELARREGRDYEPASVLLERIRAEREMDNGRPPKKQKKQKE